MDPEFRVGKVVSKSFSIYFKNFVPFTVTAMVLILPATICSIAAILGHFSPISTKTLTLSAQIANFLLGCVISGALVFASFEALRGNSPSVGASMSKGFRAAFAVVIVSILVGLLVGVGFLLLVVPGIIAIAVCAVAIPAAVVEKPGLIGALERSKELTKGYRWRILGVFLLYAIIVFVASAVMNLAIGFGVMASGAKLSGGLILGAATIDWVLSAMMAALNASLAAVMYHDLRVVKDGVGIEELASVFD